MPEYPRAPFKKSDSTISPKVATDKLSVYADPTSTEDVGNREYNDSRYAPARSWLDNVSDPGINEAVSTTIIDAYDGIVITLTTAGNSQTLDSPTDTSVGKNFTIISNNTNGSNNIEVNGITMSAGEAKRFIWDGDAWISVHAVDADDINFDPAGDISATTIQAAIEELDDEKVKRITSVDNEIARFDGTSGDIQGYTSNAPTISDDGKVTLSVADGDALELGGSSAEGGDLKIYRDSSNNLQLSVDADAASNAKALDVYGGVVSQNYLTVGQSSLDTNYPVSIIGRTHSSDSFSTTQNYFANANKGLTAWGVNQSNLICGNINITGTDATDHDIKLQIDSNDIIVARATGDGAGGIDSDSKKAIISGQLQGDLLNNQTVQKMIFDVLGLMTDPRCLYAQWEDPSAGTLYDSSGQGHNGTYQGAMTSGDRVMKAMGWSLDPDGSDDYVSLGDSDDFSFGDGSNDEAVTWFGVIEVVDGADTRMLFSKRDDTAGSEAREWDITLSATEILRLYQWDESVNVSCNRTTDAALSTGWHSFVITSPGDGGATAMNNVVFYVDGVLVASTATNNASYVAMENLTVPAWIGSSRNASGVAAYFLQDDVGLLGIDGAEWNSFDAWRFHMLVKGIYNL